MQVSRPVDGHIDRLLSGKTVERVTKDGTFWCIETTEGNVFRFALADDQGNLLKGEPVLVRVDAKATLKGITVGSAFGKR